MDIPFIVELLQRVPVPEFTRNVILSQQNFEWMIVKHNHSVEECQKPWTRAYGKSSFAKIEKILFGEDKYERYIGRVQRLEPNLPEFFNIDLTSDYGEEDKMVIYDPLMYVLMGTGLIWVVALSQPQSHTNALYICELIHHDIEQGDLRQRGFGFIQQDFVSDVQVIKNDYNLHQNLDQTAGLY
jgi:hypothetical protein